MRGDEYPLCLTSKWQAKADSSASSVSSAALDRNTQAQTLCGASCSVRNVYDRSALQQIELPTTNGVCEAVGGQGHALDVAPFSA